LELSEIENGKTGGILPEDSCYNRIANSTGDSLC